MPSKPRASVTQPSDQSYRLIALTRGQITKVSTEDFEYLSKFLWHSHWNPGTQSFYAKRVNGSKAIYIHQVILKELMKSNQPRADHKSHDTLDNRRENLRPCTQAQNCRNKRRRKSRSGFQGVRPTPCGMMWQTFITLNGNKIYLGQYTTREEAARVYDEAAKRLHGEFATLNFPTHRLDQTT